LGVLAVGIALAAAVRLLPTLRLQVAALALLAVCLPLAVVLASGWVMFGMHDDAKVLSVAIASALAALVGALLLTRWILGPLERLRAASARLASQEEYLPSIREQLDTLSVLVEDLFELARIDAGVLTLELHDARLGDLVAGCLRALDAEARARNIHLAAHVDPADPTVRIAPEKIERVLLNLLTNAVRHTPSDGAVSVVVRPEPEHVVVAVEDTGAGLT